ncbi:glycosyltransferase family 2 protein [Pseudorhizobium xiangyangii]|uniref:glycosyltransferase family 2 protein n=1 Tax=Pseudorhizobium xiangyangii TaxID=2883104 RepID=UPI0028F4369E|nr:glycosyltransferase family 2 protein [Neorhizobium xiangyangii]
MSDAVKSPDVSFVIAAYNAQETLARAIDSALAQTDVTVEVVVVDDCSTDNTASVAASYDDPRVRLIKQLSNGGPGRTRNAGIIAATGRWIAVLDSDDAVRPGRSRQMIQRAQATNAQVVVDNLDVVPMNGGPSETMFAESELAGLQEVTLAAYIDSNVIFRSTFNFGYMKPIFERDFLLRHDLWFDEALRIGEDYILLVSFLAAGAKCAIEPSSGYIYHLREDSISRVLERHHVESMLAADHVFLSRFPLRGEAMAAQSRRTRSLEEARAFITLVEEIKKKSLGGVLLTAIRNPRAVRHLRMPLAVRMRRLARAVGVNPIG